MLKKINVNIGSLGSTRRVRRIASIAMCALLAFPAASVGQEVEQRLDSLQILIGEQTQLRLKVTAPKGSKIVMPTFKPSEILTPGIEVVEQSNGDTTVLDNGKMQVSRNYTLTSFDERVYAIPALPVKVNGKSYQGNQLALKVLTVPVDTVHLNQYYPPKGVQDNPFMWSEWSPLFWLSILVLILFGAMAWLWQRLRQNKPIVIRMRIVKRIPPHEKALCEINVIKQHHATSQETQKEYYTRLTTTLREYIEERFGFRAMEMTSSEIIEHLHTAANDKMIDELKQLFRTADLVKFAKYETFLNENDANLVNAINFIDQTKTNEQVTEEKEAPQLTEQDRKTQGQRELIKGLLWAGAIIIVALMATVIYGAYQLLM